MLDLLKWLFKERVGRLVSSLVGAGVLVGSFLLHNAHQQAIGARKAHTATEKANATAVTKAAAAAAKSRDPAARGVLNPRYRAD